MKARRWWGAALLAASSLVAMGGAQSQTAAQTPAGQAKPQGLSLIHI